MLDKCFENHDVAGRREPGPLQEVQRWQNMMIVTQNMLTSKKLKTGKELSEHIAKPTRSHTNCTEYTDKLHILLGMKATVNGLAFQSLDNKTSIHHTLR